ncbi:MAG: hypothetical protein AB7E85_00795 [Pseudobdellovibrionaceae bacterium]
MDLIEPTRPENLPPELREQLVKLPFRVGLFVSEADTTGGEESAHQERVVLETMLISYVQDYCKSEYVQRIMEETVKRRKEWASWKENIANTPEEAHACFTRMCEESFAHPRELIAFKDNLLEIAYSVAMTYREEPYPTFISSTMQVVGMAVKNRLRAWKGKQPIEADEMEEMYENVSVRERAAIDLLIDKMESPILALMTKLDQEEQDRILKAAAVEYETKMAEREAREVDEAFYEDLDVETDFGTGLSDSDKKQAEDEQEEEVK